MCHITIRTAVTIKIPLFQEKYFDSSVRFNDTRTFLYSRFRASWLYINKTQRDATVCRCLFNAKLFYMFRVSVAPIIRSTSNSNCSFWYKSITCQRNVLLWHVIRPVPEAAVTIWCTPDDGCDRHPKHVDSTRCNSMQVFIYCKITLPVSGVCRTHHQEYIKL